MENHPEVIKAFTTEGLAKYGDNFYEMLRQILLEKDMADTTRNVVTLDFSSLYHSPVIQQKLPRDIQQEFGRINRGNTLKVVYSDIDGIFVQKTTPSHDDSCTCDGATKRKAECHFHSLYPTVIVDEPPLKRQNCEISRKFPDGDVELVMSQTGKSRDECIAALIAEKGDLVNAIMSLDD